MEDASIRDQERNALILRRTLSAISWLYALFNGALGALGSETPVGRLMLAHAVLLSTAALMIWKPRRGALLFVIAAGAASLGFVLFDLRVKNNVEAAIVDAIYPIVAAALLIKSRR